MREVLPPLFICPRHTHTHPCVPSPPPPSQAAKATKKGAKGVSAAGDDLISSIKRTLGLA